MGLTSGPSPPLATRHSRSTRSGKRLQRLHRDPTTEGVTDEGGRRNVEGLEEVTHSGGVSAE